MPSPFRPIRFTSTRSIARPLPRRPSRETASTSTVRVTTSGWKPPDAAILWESPCRSSRTPTAGGAKATICFSLTVRRHLPSTGPALKTTFWAHGTSGTSHFPTGCLARPSRAKSAPAPDGRCTASTSIRRSRLRDHCGPPSSTVTPTTAPIIIPRSPTGTRRSHTPRFPRSRQWNSGCPGFTRRRAQASNDLRSEIGSRISARTRFRQRQVTWFPDWAGSARQLDWTSNLRDWCISRQRYWGIPLPIWRCAKCHHWTVVGSAESLRSANGYQEGMDLHRPGIDRVVFPCEKCDGEMRRVPGTVDVWFDSGVSSWASLGYPAREDEFRRWWPQDWIVEGPDQTRGWFNSQLAAGVVAFDRAPYDPVLMHGWVNGPDGRQMHKSLGNVIEPETVVDKFGVDPLRFYVIAVNAPWDDITFQEEGVRNAQRTLNILWNVLRFATTYMVLDRFDPFAADLSSTEGHLRPEDRWLLSRLEGLKKTVDLEMRSYNLHRAARAVESFILDDLSRWYVKLVRGRTWTGTDDPDKLAAYHVLFEALSTLALLLAPVTPHIAEAIYQRLDGRKLSVHMLDWPKVREPQLRPELERSMLIVQELVEVVSKERQKGGRKLRWPLKLIAVRSATPDAADALAALEDIFLDQVNAKELAILGPADELPGTVVVAKPDPAAIGKAYKALAPKVVKLLGTQAPDEMEKAFKRGPYTIHADGQTFAIEPTMVRFEKALPPEVVRVETRHGEIYLDLRVTPELQAEAYARELIRRIQQMRKDLDLDVDDFIATVIKTDKELAASLDSQKAFIARETRSRSLTFTDKPVESEHVVEWNDVDGHTVTIGVTPLHLSEAIREFTRVPGITVQKAMALFDAGYKSLAALRSATKQELLAVDGLDAGDVDRI